MPDGSPDELGTDELVAEALVLDDDDESADEDYWAIVSELQRRGDRRTFETARALCSEASDPARCLGVSILAQLGYTEGRPFLEESLPVVVALCGEGASDDLLVASIRALGLLGDPRGSGPVLSHRRHPDASVRLAVAQSAYGVAGDPPQTAVLDAVMRLTQDVDDGVRNWATFSLGSLFEVDTPRVRDALLARIGDADADTAGEALVGLAERKDPRAVEHIVAALVRDGDRVADLVVEAAARSGDPRCLPALYALRDGATRVADAHGGWLGPAIDACEGKPFREVIEPS